MNMKIYFIYFIFLLLGGLVFFAGCLEEGNPDNGAVSFLVEVQSSAFGTKEQPPADQCNKPDRRG